jgi:hypothetical protein
VKDGKPDETLSIAKVVLVDKQALSEAFMMALTRDVDRLVLEMRILLASTAKIISLMEALQPVQEQK